MKRRLCQVLISPFLVPMFLLAVLADIFYIATDQKEKADVIKAFWEVIK